MEAMEHVHRPLYDAQRVDIAFWLLFMTIVRYSLLRYLRSSNSALILAQYAPYL